jgi:hypothetical protein
VLEEPRENLELEIPEEPVVEGGLLSEKAGTQLEPRTAVDTSETFPFDDIPPNAECILP